ncbi:MAG: hypothetical protein MK116_11200 [Phycisphaerales bacterium]|nr:hypothetical protein [Phycisphaerales bacterium]
MGRVIAMWSGPRNISTAMMRAWENRADTTVWDEPLYACYLDQTGLSHPGRDHVLQAHAHEIPYEAVATRLVQAPDSPVVYQKHMAHHLLPGMDRAWMDDATVTHAFLLRDPREMILSLHARYPEMGLADTGMPQQVEIFQRCREAGETPPVVVARDVLENPRGTLASLCDVLQLDFDEAMLSWPSGSRDSDGAWADFWYDSVRASTGFETWRPREGELPTHLVEVHEECQALYDQLHVHRIVA